MRTSHLRAIPKPTQVYHAAFTAKLILVGIVFYVSSLLSGRSEVAIKFQEQEAKWGKINMMAAILVVLFARLINVAPRVARDIPNSDNSSHSTLMAPETTTVDINSTDEGNLNDGQEIKKRLAVIRKKQKDLQHRIVCVKQQNDEPGELEALEAELAKITTKQTS